jgi:hypothetical protein
MMVFFNKSDMCEIIFTHVIIYAMFGHSELTQRSTYFPTINMHPIKS